MMKRLLLWVILMCCMVFAQAQAIPQPAQPGFKLVFEKTYLHTDRDIYAPGDTLWFKAYLVNAQDNKLINSSNNLYVDLISGDARVLRSILIRLDNGTGNGDIDLPDTLVTGTYRLRAYTNWMRNFGDNFIFEKTLTVIGDKTATDAPVIATKNKKTIPVNTSTAITPPLAAVPAASVYFFPEGGSLMEGINSIVAVKAGDAKPVAGAVISSAGDTVAHFNCDSLGMGMFALLPLKGQYYRAVVKGISYPIPNALSVGLALQVRPTDSLLRVVISRSDTSYKSAMLTVKHVGITVLSQQVVLSAEQVAAKIPVAGLPEGICAITLVDRQNRPQCERLVYIQHPQANANLMVKTDKATYNPKEKVSVTVTSEPNTSLSVAVADAAMVDAQADNITSNLMVSSELRGNIEHPARYFDTTNINRYKQLDLLLMTQGWRDFVWRRLADTAIRISYAAEYNLRLQGNLTENNSVKPLPHIQVSLYADMALGNKLFATTTDSSGRYYFNTLVQYGKGPVVLTALNDKGQNAGTITVDSAQISLPVTRTNSSPSISQSYPLLIEHAKKQWAAINITKLKEVKVKAANYIQLRDTRLTTLGYEDEVFKPQFADKQMTIKNYILSVSKQARIENAAKANAGKMVFGGNPDQVRESRMVFYADGETQDPRLIVDGYELATSLYSSEDEIVKTNMYNRYFDLSVDKAEKILIKRGVTPPSIGSPKHQFATINGSTSQSVVLPGKTIFVIYLTLKPGAMESSSTNVASLQLSGYYHARTFYQPPPNAKPQLADYRSTIHWEPNIKTDANGKATVSFYNAVPQTDVKIIVQGVTDKGMPVSATASYKSPL